VTCTTTATLAAALCLSAGLAVPATASAVGGGTEAPTGETGGAPAAAGGSGQVAAGDGTLRAGRSALLGRYQRIAGTLSGIGAGREVVLQRSDRTGWVTIARTETASGGAFSAVWRADRVGRFTLRALPAGDAVATSAAGALTARMTVYLPAIATHYGPGWYGTRTACGTILTSRTIGVAHRTLPCGTLVEFSYRGRTVRAAVVDRGPYANNADWDLTVPASRALRFNGKDYVGAIRVGRISLKRR
jgi:rare lipoprotein A